MFRTISKPAKHDYVVFRQMILEAIVASLKKMAFLQYARVIMAAPSADLYAGIWKKFVQDEYHSICYEALRIVYKNSPYRFSQVIMPRFKFS
jgi:hypothetical protein